MLFKTTLPLRFWQKIHVLDNGCWEWTSAHNSAGYSSFSFKGKTVLAHRISYECLVGPFPPRLHADHLCRNCWCVNPKHIEPVTGRENVLRGDTIPAMHAKKTHCIHGHSFEGVPLMRGGRRFRYCPICARRAQAKHRRIKKGHILPARVVDQRSHGQGASGSKRHRQRRGRDCSEKTYPSPYLFLCVRPRLTP